MHQHTLHSGVTRYSYWLAVWMIILPACTKYLDKKPRNDLAVPSTLNEMQAVLDNRIVNDFSTGDLEFVADNYFVSDAAWSSSGLTDQKAYIWDKEISNTSDYAWNDPYKAIFQANFVLDALEKIAEKTTEPERYNQIKGAALFYRAFHFHQAAQLFCRPYTNSAATDPGIVLRLNANVTEKSVRSTVQQTYDQVISDLKIAASLLPLKALVATRPNKAAAYGALARTYLAMRDYTNAGLYANEGLSLNDTLLDYNQLKPAGNPILPVSFVNNPEVLFACKEDNFYDLLSPAKATIDSVLYKSYNTNDLRKKVFYTSDGTRNYFKGSYVPDMGANYMIFDGIATDEMYMIRAESYARAGKTVEAMQDLNKLLRKRYLTGTFTDLSATDAADALQQVLTERRKELAFRGLRWSDLRRLNVEGANITIARKINGTLYTLPPNDLRWVMLIPFTEVNRSGIAQNPR